MKKISAKRLRDMLEQVVVHNEYDLFKHVKPSPPVISYAKSDRHQYARWRVWRVGHKTDPERGHFLDGHSKTFTVNRTNVKQSQLVLAIDWASEKYGYTIDEWVKTPYGSWAPRTAIEAALRHYLPELFETSVYVPPTVLPDMRPLDEVIRKVPAGDPVVKKITDKLYGEDPEWAESEPNSRKIPSHGDVTTGVDDGTDGTHHWYEVKGASVTVFIQATDADDAKKRVTRMINRITMDCSLELHITKRDPKVHEGTPMCPAGNACSGAAFPGHPAHTITDGEN